jgi:Fe-S-cluster-containing dehydrogenase component
MNVLLIDIDRCNICYKCQIACKDEQLRSAADDTGKRLDAGNGESDRSSTVTLRGAG